MMVIMMMVVMMAMAGAAWFAGTDKQTNKHFASKPFVKCLAFFKHGFV